MADPTISVVVLAYNMAPYLAQCLDSLCCQTFGDFEVVVVNDGSTDTTSEIAHRAARDDPRFIVVDNAQNRGTFVARRIGAERSRGKYLCMIDGDDWLVPSFLEELITAARRLGADVVECSAIGVLPDGRGRVVFRAETSPRRARGHDILRQSLGRDIWHVAWSKMFERSLYLKAAPLLGAIDDHLVIADDKLFMLPILGFAQCFAHIDRALYRYRMREDSSTRLRGESADTRHIAQTSRVDDHLQAMFAELGLAGEYAPLIARNRDDEIMIALRIIDRYPEGHPHQLELKRLLRSSYGSRTVDAIDTRRSQMASQVRWLAGRYSLCAIGRMAWRSAKRAAGIALCPDLDRPSN